MGIIGRFLGRESNEEVEPKITSCCEKYDESYKGKQNIDISLRLNEKDCLHRMGTYTREQWKSYPKTFEKESKVYSQYRCRICGREIHGPDRTRSWKTEEVVWKEELNSEGMEEYRKKVEA